MGRLTKILKMVITRVIWGPPWPEFCMHLSFISSNIFLSPKVFNFNENIGFLRVLGDHKNAKSGVYIGLPIFTMVNTQRLPW